VADSEKTSKEEQGKKKKRAKSSDFLAYLPTKYTILVT
uniref:Uncharacterized protein n=1 Tax=Caenorhabditis japonica TaxID=281687 RepID=A0A2Q4SIY8_CAEJA